MQNLISAAEDECNNWATIELTEDDLKSIEAPKGKETETLSTFINSLVFFRFKEEAMPPRRKCRG